MNKSKIIRGVLGSLLVVAVLGLAVGAYAIFRLKDVIPATVRSQLTFTPFVVQPTDELKTTETSFKYDSEHKVMSYEIITQPGGKTVTVTEQATPSEFIDIPAAFDKLKESIKPHLTFDSQHGVISVGSVNGSTDDLMVLKDGGVLLFARVNGGTLGDDAWRSLVTSLRTDD